MSFQRILLVDDHEVVRLGLKSLLNRHTKFQVVAEAATGEGAVAKVEQYHPDVVVMDIRLPGGSGIEACEKIIEKYPETKIIMLTSYAEDEMLFSAIRAGASGYVLKQVGSNELIDAIEAVGRGEGVAVQPLGNLLIEIDNGGVALPLLVVGGEIEGSLQAVPLIALIVHQDGAIGPEKTVLLRKRIGDLTGIPEA